MAALAPTACCATLQSSSQSRFCVGESPFLKLRCSARRGDSAGRACQWRAEAGGREYGVGKHSSKNGDVGRADASPISLERRELLAASVAGVSTLLTYPALGVPVTPPDLTKCEQPTDATSGQPILNVTCCLPETASAPKAFTPSPGTVLKVRTAANKVDADYIAKYNKAYELMRALPDTDPRSFKQQADVHCAFCNGVYPSPQNSSAELQIHFSYIFFPWHRYYLYFHEKILASLIDDPSFALPFWNWDDQQYGGNVMPAFFTQSDTYPSLYNENRNQNHLPPSINTLSLSSANQSDAEIIANNLSVMYTSTVTPTTTATLFMGAAPLFGDLTDEASIGSLEQSPHTAIHVWTGDPRQTNGEDMGNFYSAGRDPLFFSHHANVDRMWTVWDTLPGRRKDLYTDSDFLNSSFVFYNENSELVQVYVKDCMDSENQLGITYAEAPGDQLWLSLQTTPLGGVKGVVPAAKAQLAEVGAAAKGKTPKELTTTLSTLVTRPTNLAEFAKSQGLSESEVQEVLVLQDVQVPKSSATSLAVFLNLPDADSTTSLNCAEYVGSYANVPHVGKHMSTSSRRTNVKFSISDNIRRLGIEDQTTITVTVVVKVLDTGATVTIAGFKIIYI